jgi:hypothetical protein
VLGEVETEADNAGVHGRPKRPGRERIGSLEVLCFITSAKSP